MERISLISDSHIPSRASKIPDWVAENIKNSDYTIHAGDFDSKKSLEKFREISNLTAVSGNMDPKGLELPDINSLKVQEIEFIVTHGTGSPKNYENRIKKTAEKHSDKEKNKIIAVAGHTHELIDKKKNDIRILNPGSCTGAYPASKSSMITLEVKKQQVNVEKIKQ